MRLRPKLTQLRPDLLAFATSLTLEPSEAEDLVQEAILRALLSPATPRNGRDLRPWMFRIVRNLFIDARRRERVRRQYSGTDAHVSGSGRETDADPVETILVRQAFAGLSRRDREILSLVDILGLSYAEAAEALGVPAGTVMSRLSRARRAMIEAIGNSNVRPIGRRSNGRGANGRCGA